MEITVSSQALSEYQGDAVVVGLAEGASLAGPAAEADRALDGLIGRLVESREIRGKQCELTILHTQGKLPAAPRPEGRGGGPEGLATRVAVVGLGKPGGDDLLAMRRAMGAAARALRDRGCRRVGTALHQQVGESARPEHSLRAVVEGAYVGLYRGEECKSERELPDELEEMCLLGIAREAREAAASTVRAARIAGEATNYARRLVNLPANEMTPSRLAEEAREVAARAGLEVEVLEPEQIGALGMGGFLAVARGSEEPARLIVLRRRGNERGPRVAFVGKGLTFDSGGISLKPAEKMETMKGDMAGAAAVLAAMGAVGELKLDLDVMGVIPATENLPSGRALKPGDVVKMLNGKTVEIISTDAEGRMIVADALAYARQLGATHLIDLATLTGACIIALGHIAAGVMGNDTELVEAVLQAGERAGERMWQLPLFPEYRKQLDSKIADLKNVGGRPAGAITGGWFLREFVGDTAWVHLDIAGTAWSEADEPHQIEGATGAGTRTLIALAERMAGGTAG